VDYLIKPVVPSILQAKVRELVALWQQTQEAKRQAKLLRLMIEGTQEYAIFMLDPAGNVVTWNPGAERIKGYRAEEIIGQHFSVFYPPEDVRERKPWHQMASRPCRARSRRRPGGCARMAAVLGQRGPDGATRRGRQPVRLFDDHPRRDRPAPGRTGRPRLFQEQAARAAAEASALEARRAQHEERRHREQLHVTLSSIGDAVIAADVAGRVIFLNPVAESLTGWKSRDAVGQALEKVFHIINEETRQPVENPVTKVLREGVVVGLANHTVLIDRHGVERPIDDSAAPIRARARPSPAWCWSSATLPRRAGRWRPACTWRPS